MENTKKMCLGVQPEEVCFGLIFHLHRGSVARISYIHFFTWFWCITMFWVDHLSLFIRFLSPMYIEFNLKVLFGRPSWTSPYVHDCCCTYVNQLHSFQCLLAEGSVVKKLFFWECLLLWQFPCLVSFEGNSLKFSPELISRSPNLILIWGSRTFGGWSIYCLCHHVSYGYYLMHGAESKASLLKQLVQCSRRHLESGGCSSEVGCLSWMYEAWNSIPKATKKKRNKENI